MLLPMAGGEIPVWAAIAVAGIGAIGGIAGSAATALWARSNERARLHQELLLHGARERLEVLEQAIAVASDYREKVADALRSFEELGEKAEFVGTGLWRWDTDNAQVLKRHEAALKLRFGMKPVTGAWEFWEWLLAEAAVFCETNRTCVEDSASDKDKPIPDDVRRQAQHWRDATRQALESFITTAAGAVAGSAQPPPTEGASRIRRWVRK
jgi:hypothetical protein